MRRYECYAELNKATAVCLAIAQRDFAGNHHELVAAVNKLSLAATNLRLTIEESPSRRLLLFAERVAFFVASALLWVMPWSFLRRRREKARAVAIKEFNDQEYRSMVAGRGLGAEAAEGEVF